MVDGGSRRRHWAAVHARHLAGVVPEKKSHRRSPAGYPAAVNEPPRIRAHEREAETEHVEDQAAPAGPAAASARGVIALQRSVGNVAVSRWIASSHRLAVARDGPAPDAQVAPAAAPPVTRVSYVFLMGDFKNDRFYRAAREYFVHMVPSAILVPDKRTLAEVISYVNAAAKPVDTLFIVSHANESGNLGFSMDEADLAKDKATGDHKPRTEFKEVREANAKGTLPTADVAFIDDQTKVQIKGCNVGRSELMMDELDKTFGGKASVTAPTHTQEYKVHGDGKGSVVYEENLAEMFIEQPGIAAKDAATLEAEFKAKYTMVPDARWKGLLKTVKQEDKTRTQFTWKGVNPPADDEKAVFARIGAEKKWPAKQKWVMSYEGRETVGDKWTYKVKAERVTDDGGTEFQTASINVDIPPAEDVLIAQEKAKHGRPDAVNWRVKRTENGADLKLEVIAERTEWVIDGTIEDASGPYHPAAGDKDWFKTSTYAPPPPSPP
jgi:hypothetical protein